MDDVLPSLGQVLSSWAAADGSWALTPDEEADEQLSSDLGIRRVGLRSPVAEAWLRGVLRRRLLRDGWQCLDEVTDQSADAERKRRIDVLALRTPDDRSWGLFQRLALEIKVSRADFLTDVRESSKQELWRAQCHAHAFVAPAGLIRPEEVPTGSGLLEVGLQQILGRGVEYPRLWWSVPPLPRDADPVPDWLLHELMYRAAARDAAKYRKHHEARIPAGELTEAGWPRPAVGCGAQDPIVDEVDSVDDADRKSEYDSRPTSTADGQQVLDLGDGKPPAAGAGFADGSAERSLQVALEWLSLRPVTDPAADEYVECWQQGGDNDWEHLDPQEDLAIAPDLDWPHEIKVLALAAYQQRYGKYLEDGEFYVLMWPPRGRLWSGGDWHYPNQHACDEHGYDGPDGQCADCVAATEQPVVVQPAQWEWVIEVQTWTLHARPDGMKVPVRVIDDDGAFGTDRWTLGYTTMDPRQVWFGQRS